MKNRYFEFVNDTSAKFWSVTVSGSDVTVCFGRIGTGGQTQTKTLSSPAAATSHAEKSIASKVAKGYLEKPAC